MFRLIKKLILIIIANGAALYLADKYVSGFSLAHGLGSLAIAALILTVINILIRPILKIVLWPLLIITLGLGSIIINALAIFILDYFVPSVTITGVIPLLYTTLIVSGLNIVATILTKEGD